MISQPGGPGAFWSRLQTKKKLLWCDGPCARFILTMACRVQGAKAPWALHVLLEYRPEAGCVMSQFFTQNARLRIMREKRTFSAGRAGMQSPGAVIGGPT